MKTPKIRAPNPTLFRKVSISFITYTPKWLCLYSLIRVTCTIACQNVIIIEISLKLYSNLSKSMERLAEVITFNNNGSCKLPNNVIKDDGLVLWLKQD